MTEHNNQSGGNVGSSDRIAPVNNRTIAAVEEQIRKERERALETLQVADKVMRNLSIDPQRTNLKHFFPYMDVRSNADAIRRWTREKLPEYSDCSFDLKADELSADLHRHLLKFVDDQRIGDL